MAAILDTGYFVALANKRDQNHASADQLARTRQERRILLSSVLPEAMYLIANRAGYLRAAQFARTLTKSYLTLELVTMQDLARVSELMEQYQDSRLDFVDCTIIAVAERLNITRIWTFDRRDFLIVRPRHAEHFDLLPER